MKHEWIFDVLTDLKAYAERHGMVRLAEKADEALEIAKVETAFPNAEHAPKQKH